MVFLILSLILHWIYLSLLLRKQRFSTIFIYSGIIINSFNSPIIHLRLNTDICQSNIISIIDNNNDLLQISNLPMITMILSDGYHHLDLVIFDEQEHIELYQEIDIATGNQSLRVNVLDKQYKPVENISVYLELVDYTNINHQYQTNQYGEVIFHYLPTDIQVYIEVICMNTKRQAYAQINTLNYQNITLILKEMNTSYDEEYDKLDRGYYAI